MGEIKGNCGKSKIFALCWLLGCVSSMEAVVFFSTGDSHYNTSAPTGELAGSGWDLQGDAFPGVPIAPNFFIAATHVGGKAGDVFAFQGFPYFMTARFDHPDADITIWRVAAAFPVHAEIYLSSDEVGQRIVVFGRGTERGEEVRSNGVLKGWSWGKTDGILRWGENVVAGISDAEGKPAQTGTRFQLLRADFDTNGGPNEAHLSGGDSGGGVFIQDQDGVWKLAGMNHAANYQYSSAQLGDAFYATLFDESGYFEGDPGKREYHPDDPALYQPGSFFATRLSVYAEWIKGILEGGASTILLEEALSLFGPYRPAADASVDPDSQTISIPQPEGTRFYRIAADRAVAIVGMVRDDQHMVLSYQ